MTSIAIYARYSTDRQNPLSAEDQIRLLRSHADKQGWQVVAVYQDPEISGRKTKERLDYQRMVKDAKAGQFRIVLVEDTDRLSRGIAETARLADLLNYANVKIFTPMGQVEHEMLIFRAMMAQKEIEKIAIKTRRGLLSRIERGKSAGGLVYGYATVCDDKGNIQKGERTVVEEQAAVVRRIFMEFAEGRMPKEIAARLNAARAPSSRGGTWAGGTVRSMLKNEIYRGKLVWNRKQWKWSPEDEKRVPTTDPDKRDFADLIVHDVPALRIVSDDLWQQVQKRRAGLATAQAERVAVKGAKTRGGRSPKYLFTTILKCGVCGGNYSRSGNHRLRCSTYQNRGPEVCSNRISVRQDVLESKLLHTIRVELFDDEAFEQFKAEARKVLQERLKNRNKDIGNFKRDLARVEKEISGIIALAKMGKASPTLAQELEKAEAEKRRLEAELDTDLPAVANLDELLEGVLARYASMCYNISHSAAKDVSKARNMIKALVGGSIVLEPTSGDGLNARLRGDVGGLIALVEDTRKVAALARPRFAINFPMPERIVALVPPRSSGISVSIP